MSKFNVPSKKEVSEKNQAIFDNIELGLGFVPNLYAYYAKNDTALEDYLAFANRKTTLNKREKEVINLIVSQSNECAYCLSAHTTIAELNGFSRDEIIELRKGGFKADKKIDALAKFTHEVINHNGKVSEEGKEVFFDAGYDEANLIDVVLSIGEKTISNFIYNIAGFDIDFPLPPSLDFKSDD